MMCFSADGDSDLITRVHLRSNGATVHAVRNALFTYSLASEMVRDNPDDQTARSRLAEAVKTLAVYADTGQLEKS